MQLLFNTFASILIPNQSCRLCLVSSVHVHRFNRYKKGWQFRKKEILGLCSRSETKGNGACFWDKYLSTHFIDSFLYFALKVFNSQVFPLCFALTFSSFYFFPFQIFAIYFFCLSFLFLVLKIFTCSSFCFIFFFNIGWWKTFSGQQP